MMPESLAERHRRWGVEELLDKYPDLRIIPSRDECLKVGGDLHFHVRGPDEVVIEDSYRVEVRIPPGFPTAIPTVFETGGRTPETYHKLADGSLCLAAPTELRLRMRPTTSLAEFVKHFVVPYLFGYSHYEKHGVLPYGELEHGKEGLRQHFASLFGISDRRAAQEFVRLASLKKRPANREPCPCGSRRRLGRCHNKIVNGLREKLGRGWFASEYAAISQGNVGSADRPEDRLPKILRKRRRRRVPRR